MTLEQLNELRGLVARGQLGCGPKTSGLVRELLAAYDALTMTRNAAVGTLSIAGWRLDWADSWRRDGVRIVAADDEIMIDGCTLTMAEYSAFAALARGDR